MILGIGVDHVAVARFHRLLAHANERTLHRLALPRELAHCLAHARPAEAFAARWAAKEAVAKCLGSGFADGITPRSIEIERSPSGAPEVRLHDAALALAARRGIRRIHLTTSHDEATAIAFAVAES